MLFRAAFSRTDSVEAVRSLDLARNRSQPSAWWMCRSDDVGNEEDDKTVDATNGADDDGKQKQLSAVSCF